MILCQCVLRCNNKTTDASEGLVSVFESEFRVWGDELETVQNAHQFPERPGCPGGIAEPKALEGRVIVAVQQRLLLTIFPQMLPETTTAHNSVHNDNVL